MDGTVTANIRKQKATVILYIAVFVILSILVIWMMDIRSFNTDVENTQCQIDNVPQDGCTEYQTTLEYETKVKDRKRSYLLPVFLILALAGIIIGFMFLPGYPFSKYLSYEDCQKVASLYPADLWNWSSPASGSDTLCKLFGACVCRSFIQESNCQNFKDQNNDASVVYNFDLVQKKNKEKNFYLNRCGCCSTDPATGVVSCNGIEVTGGSNGQSISYNPVPCTTPS